MISIADGNLLACLSSTLFMTGLIWFVQIVHYPLFARVGAIEFEAYHADHSRKTTFVVIGPMLVELATSLAMIAWRPSGVPPILVWLGLAAASISWMSTGLIQVPCHGRLASGFDGVVGGRLVATNWLRVASWSVHSVLLIFAATARIVR